MEIRLLDGEVREQEYLLSNMTDDNFYYVELGTDRCLSYSSAKQLIESPKWFEHKRRKPDPETQALRDGRLVHAAILEPQKYDSFTFVDTSTKNTKKWKLAVEQNGKAYTYTNKEKYMNNRITTAFMQNDRCVEFLKDSQVEVGALEMFGKIPVRAKADILRAGEFVADVKTTNDGLKQIEIKNGAVKNQFAFTVDKYDYDLQAYLYTQIYNVPDFYWLVIDKTTTDIGIFKASQETLNKGKLKLEACLQLYEAFFIDELIDLSQFYVESEI